MVFRDLPSRDKDCERPVLIACEAVAFFISRRESGRLKIFLPFIKQKQLYYTNLSIGAKPTRYVQASMPGLLDIVSARVGIKFLVELTYERIEINLDLEW